MIASAVAPADLAASYAYCERVAREQARNFYHAFRVLPAGKRRAFCAVYAFSRLSDDISDAKAALDDPARRRQLAAWRARLTAALEGDYGAPGTADALDAASRLLPAFHDTVVRYSIPPRYFYELIDGMEMDLSGLRVRTFDDLYRYCYHAAGVVGLICVHIYGFAESQRDEACRRAEACGIAFQLTNILRDLREDSTFGRVYLPEEDLARFGYPVERLNAGIEDREYRALVEFEAMRAASYYRESLPLLDIVSADCRPALWAMVAIYGGILCRMRAQNFPMLRRRVELSDMDKAVIVLRAFGMRLGIGGGSPFPASALG